MALDSPMKLKASVPGKNVLEASFATPPADWVERLERLPAAEKVTGEDGMFRIASTDGPATTKALIEAAEAAGIAIHSLAIQSTTLDDVFVHYTGRQLRDSLQVPSAADRTVMAAPRR
jgi:ABC-2 type transport system ATP-binding protein